jgi:TRAP-type C4-dicarboxylate transport system permease small subunit
MLGLMVAVVLIFGSIAYSYSSPLSAAIMPSGGITQVLLFLALVALLFFPALFMLKFSNKMLQALNNNDQYTLVASFRQLKLYYKYIGILTIVILSIYALMFLIGIVFAVSR